MEKENISVYINKDDFLSKSFDDLIEFEEIGVSLLCKGSSYSHINFKPPESVARAATRGLDLRKKASPSNRGGLTTSEAAKHGIGSGVARAASLKNRQNISPSTVRRMKAFFDRHSAYKHKHKTDPGGKAHVSWLLWGGDPGYAWSKKIVRQMEAADKKK